MFLKTNSRFIALISGISIADKSKFEQEGIPNIYYDIIKYQLEETSIGIKMLLKEFPDKSMNIEEDLKNCKEQYWDTERSNLIKRIAL